jgi:hypothetical protein
MAYLRNAGNLPASSGFLRLLGAVLAAWLLLGLGQPARAEGRLFPPEAKKAEFAITQYPVVLLNGKPRRLSPAARIRNADNLIVMPGVLGDVHFAVRYTEDFQGEIDRVWILSSDEAHAR